MPDTSRPLTLVRKRDGRLVPFESDKISRALFAAAEEIGMADAFLARELADSVVFFLGSERDETTPSTTQIAELVIKVVRELGQPALAVAFAAGAGRKPRESTVTPRDKKPSEDLDFRFSLATPLPDVLAACAHRYGLAAVFSRDLIAVQNNGLLSIRGVQSPLELESCVLVPPISGEGLAATLEESRKTTANLVAIDGLDIAGTSTPSASAFVRDLASGLRAFGLRGVVNLNSAQPPSSAHDLIAGPLFTASPTPLAKENPSTQADLLREAFLQDRQGCVYWHLGERDFQPEQRLRLLSVLQQALKGAALTFVFDRPKSPVVLAEGLDRQNAALLLKVVLHLPKLLEATRGGDAELFIHKLGSLVRLALSSAVQKRDYLRRHRPDLGRGFLLERARLLVVPDGLDEVVQRIQGSSLTRGDESVLLAQRIVQRLATVLRQDGEACRLRTCLEIVTTCEATAPLKAQLRAIHSLHTEGELVSVVHPIETLQDPELLAGLLRWVWQRTEVARLHFRPNANYA